MIDKAVFWCILLLDVNSWFDDRVSMDKQIHSFNKLYVAGR